MGNVWSEPQTNPDTNPVNIDAGYPYYRVKLIPINGQAGEIFEAVNAAAQINGQTIDEDGAIEIAEGWHPGYQALWAHKQCANRGVNSNGFATYPQYTIRGA